MKRIGIIRGGAGKENQHYEASLQAGGKILLFMHENLADKYKPLDILVDRGGIWHLGGVPIAPAELIHKVDAVWDTLHSHSSAVLHSLSVPRAGGAPVFMKSQAILRDHLRTNPAFSSLRMPRHIILPVYQADFDGPLEKYAIKKARAVFEKFGGPWIVKTAPPHPHMGIRVAKTFGELADSIADAVKRGRSILVEELIPGRSASIHSVSGFRGEDAYVFPPLGMSYEDKEKLIPLAEALHRHLGVKDYLNSEFTINPNLGIYLTSISVIPDLEKDSDFHQACDSVGAKAHHVVEHILERIL